MPLESLIAVAAAAGLFFLMLSASAAWLRRKVRLDREISGLLSQDQYEYTILDVRRNTDFTKSHVPASRNIPYDEFDGGLPTENMFEKIFVYGPNRRIARKVARTLDRTGYFNVTCYGSFRGWKGPVVSGGTADGIAKGT